MNGRVRAALCAAATAIAWVSCAWAGQDGGFALKDSAGQHLDVLLNGRLVARYMYAYDTSSREKRTDTNKPFLHVFDAEGVAPVTKGAGGYEPHHRGIFVGWGKVVFDGKPYNFWGMNHGEQVHQKFTAQTAGPDEAAFTSVVHWNLIDGGKTVIVEERTHRFSRAPAPAHACIDLVSVLKATAGDVRLDGDPEHAGVQYRPADEIIYKETLYLFPKENPNPRADVDYPWAGETYTLPSGKRYTAIQMNALTNPKGTKFSAYRDYGRFGAFFTADLKKDETLSVKYRFLVSEGGAPPAEVIWKSWSEFTGAAAPSPLPKVVTVPGEPRTAAPAKAPAPPKQ